jgi:hypothetical protein
MAANDIRRLFRFIDWLMDLPEALDTEFWSQIKRHEEEKNMPFVTIAERTGHEKGFREGRDQGLREGKDLGLREGLLSGIDLALKLRFGTNATVLMSEICQLQDVEVLSAVHKGIETAITPDDLRRFWKA